MRRTGVGRAAAGTLLVTDGDQRAALAIVRSLGRAGYRCVVCSGGRASLAGSSRHAARNEPVPDPQAEPGAFAQAVRELVGKHAVDVVLPVSEPALLAVLAAREEIPARIPFPELGTFQAICDKAGVLREAAALGIRVPEQQAIATVLEAQALEPTFPVVLKPFRSVYTRPDGTRGKVGVRWAHDREQLAAALRRYPAEAYPVLVQEAITGPGTGVFVLLHEGRLVARFAHRRMREKPPSGGVSVLRRSEPMDEALLERSLALLERFGWSGVAMVEYKRDQATGEPVLMEVNGRFWGSLQLAIDAGVDFPRLLADLSFGRPVAPVASYDIVQSRWFWGDVDHMIARLREPATGWRERAGVVTAFLRGFGPGQRGEVFRWRDPRPFVRESVQWLADLRG